MDLEKIFKHIVDNFDGEAMSDFNATVAFELSGDGGGTHALTFANGTANYAAGAVENPTATIMMTTADFAALTSGSLNPMAAFMQGKIKVTGDMSTVMKMQGMLSA
jgi:putative sterol carrier protein